MAQDIILTVGGDARPLENVINRAVNQKRKIGSLDVRGFEQPLGRITGKASEFQKSLEASNARVIAFGASAGMIFSVQTAFSKLVESTVEVEKALTDINVLLGLNTGQLAEFSSELFAAASKNATAFGDAATAAAEFARQGLSANETIKRTSDALTLSRLSGLDFAASVQAMTAALNSFSKEALNTTEIVDRMAAVDAAFAVSSADLAEAIRRVASSADSANVSLNETIAVVTAAQQITARGGAKIGNAFKTIFTRLQRPKVLDQLEQLGVATKNAAGVTLPLMQVLQNLANTYDFLSAAQKSYISEQIGSVYQINILKAVMKDLGGEMSLYSRALETAENSMGSSEKRTEELNKTLSSKLVRSLNAAKQAAASLGKITIAPTIGGVADVGTKLFGGISEGAEKGEGAMARVGQGMLKGIGAVIQGPGLQALVTLGIKLFSNLTKFVAESAQGMGAFGQEAKQIESIQESILGHLKDNPEVLRDIKNGTLSVEAAHAKIITKIKDETSLLEAQLEVSKQLAVSLGASGVRMSPATVAGRREEDDRMMFSHGFTPSNNGSVPSSMARLETSQARKAGYTPGQAMWGPNLKDSGGPEISLINGNEKVTSFKAPDGKLKHAIEPGGGPAKAKYKRDMLSTWGLDSDKLKPGFNNLDLSGYHQGFIPNFSGKKYLEDKKLNSKYSSFAKGFIPNFTDEDDEAFERAFKPHFRDPKNLAEEFFVGVGGTLRRDNPAAVKQGRTRLEDLGNNETKLSVLGLNKGNFGKTLGSFVWHHSYQDDIHQVNVHSIEGEKMSEDLAVQYVKELSGFNSKRGDIITITSPNNVITEEFLGIGRESMAFAGPEIDGMETAVKEPLRRTYPNVLASGELQGQSDSTAAKKFEKRHQFLSALQEEGYDILGENVKFPTRIAAIDGKYVEENVFAAGGQDFLQLHKEALANGQGKETLGAIQFYLQQLQQQAHEKLGLQGGRGSLAFPNLDPRTSTLAAGKAKGYKEGKVGKMTDNVLISSLEDVEQLKKVISRPEVSKALSEYSDRFEEIKKASITYKADSNDANLDALMKLEEAQKIATANIATQFPELNEINRVVMDFETQLQSTFAAAPEYAGSTALSDKLNKLLAGRKSLAVSQGFIPSFAIKDNSEIVDKLVMLVEGGNIGTAQQLFNTLGGGNESLGDDFIAGLYARLKDITTSIAEIRGVGELEQVRGEPSIPTMIGVNTNMKGSRDSLAFLNKSTDAEVAKSKKEHQKNEDRKAELEKEMREHEAYLESYGEAGIPDPEGTEWAEKVAETSRELSEVHKAIEFSGVVSRGPYYEKNAKQIDLLDRGIRIKEALGIQTGRNYLGPSMGHGVTGTTASNPKFLNKPGEVFPGTDLPIPLNPNLVDPELLNLPPLPGTIDEITAVKYHHQDPHDYPWLGKGVSDGFIPNFVDPAMLAEIGQLITTGAMGGAAGYAGLRSMFGESHGFDPFNIDDEIKDPEWLENLVLGAADVASTDLDDLGSIPNKLRGMLGRDPKASGHIPNFLNTKPKRPGERGGKPWLLTEAVELGSKGVSKSAEWLKDLFDPTKQSKLAERYISGTLSSGYIPNFDDLEVVGNIETEKAAYIKFFKDYREGNVQNDAGIDLEVLERELAAFGPYLFATDQEGRMDPQIEAFLEANRQRLRQLGYLSGGFVPSFAASEYILQGSDGSEIERVRKTRENLEYLQQLQEKHAGSHIFSTADDGLTDEPILSKGFVPNFFFKSWAERKEERAGGRSSFNSPLGILGMESTLDDERTGVKFEHSLLGRLANVPLAAAKLGIGGIQKIVGMLPSKGGGSLSDNWDEQEDLSSLGVGVIDSLLDIGRFPFEMEGEVPAVQQFVGGSTEHPGTTRNRENARKRRERREFDHLGNKGFVPNFEKGFFDSDMIGNRTESTQIVDSIVGGNKPYEVYHGPAGAGKTTLALKDHSDATIIQSLKHYQDKKDNEDWSKFVVLSGTGRGRTSGQYSERAAAILRGATDVTAVIPDDDTLIARRLQRVKDEEARLTAIAEGEGVDRGKLDKRDLNALKGTLKAPMSDYQLYDELEAEGQNVRRVYAAGFIPNFLKKFEFKTESIPDDVAWHRDTFERISTTEEDGEIDPMTGEPNVLGTLDFDLNDEEGYRIIGSESYVRGQGVGHGQFEEITRQAFAANKAVLSDSFNHQHGSLDPKDYEAFASNFKALASPLAFPQVRHRLMDGMRTSGQWYSDDSMDFSTKKRHTTLSTDFSSMEDLQDLVNREDRESMSRLLAQDDIEIENLKTYEVTDRGDGAIKFNKGHIPNFAYPPYRGHAGDLAGDNEFAAFFNEQAVNQQWGRSEETFTQSAFDFLAKMGWGNYANASWASMIEPSDFEVDGESPSSFAHLNNFENNLGHNVGVHKYLSLMGVRASVPSYHLNADDGSWDKWGPMAQRANGTDPYSNFGHPMKELDISLFSRGGVQTVVDQFRKSKGEGFIPKYHDGGMVPNPGREQLSLLKGGEGVLTSKGVQAIGGKAGLEAANKGFVPNFADRKMALQDAIGNLKTMAGGEGIQSQIATKLLVGDYGLTPQQSEFLSDPKNEEANESLLRILNVYVDLATKAFDKEKPSPGQMEKVVPVLELMGITTDVVEIPIPEVLQNRKPYNKDYPDGIIPKTTYQGGTTELAKRLVELKGTPVQDTVNKLEEKEGHVQLGELRVLSARNLPGDRPLTEGEGSGRYDDKGKEILGKESMIEYGIRSDILENAEGIVKHIAVDNIDTAIELSANDLVEHLQLPEKDKSLLRPRGRSHDHLPRLMEGPMVGNFVELVFKRLFFDKVEGTLGQSIGAELGDTPLDIIPGVETMTDIGKKVFTEGIPETALEIKGVMGEQTSDFSPAEARKKLAKARKLYSGMPYAKGYIPNFFETTVSSMPMERSVWDSATGKVEKEEYQRKYIESMAGYLEYEDEGKSLAIMGHSSKKKGGGFAHMQRLGREARDVGKTIKSGTLVNQLINEEGSRDKLTNVDPFEAIAKHAYPQLRQRNQPGWKNTGRFGADIGGKKVDFSFKSLKNLKSQLSKFSPDEIADAIYKNKISISNLESDPGKGGMMDKAAHKLWGLKFSEGFIPSFVDVTGPQPATVPLKWLDLPEAQFKEVLFKSFEGKLDHVKSFDDIRHEDIEYDHFTEHKDENGNVVYSRQDQYFDVTQRINTLRQFREAVKVKGKLIWQGDHWAHINEDGELRILPPDNRYPGTKVDPNDPSKQIPLGYDDAGFEQELAARGFVPNFGIADVEASEATKAYGFNVKPSDTFPIMMNRGGVKRPTQVNKYEGIVPKADSKRVFGAQADGDTIIAGGGPARDKNLKELRTKLEGKIAFEGHIPNFVKFSGNIPEHVKFLGHIPNFIDLANPEITEEKHKENLAERAALSKEGKHDSKRFEELSNFIRAYQQQSVQATISAIEAAQGPQPPVISVTPTDTAGPQPPTTTVKPDTQSFQFEIPNDDGTKEVISIKASNYDEAKEELRKQYPDQSHGAREISKEGAPEGFKSVDDARAEMNRELDNALTDWYSYKIPTETKKWEDANKGLRESNPEAYEKELTDFKNHLQATGMKIANAGQKEIASLKQPAIAQTISGHAGEWIPLEEWDAMQGRWNTSIQESAGISGSVAAFAPAPTSPTPPTPTSPSAEEIIAAAQEAAAANKTTEDSAETALEPWHTTPPTELPPSLSTMQDNMGMSKYGMKKQMFWQTNDTKAILPPRDWRHFLWQGSDPYISEDNKHANLKSFYTHPSLQYREAFAGDGSWFDTDIKASVLPKQFQQTVRDNIVTEFAEDWKFTQGDGTIVDHKGNNIGLPPLPDPETGEPTIETEESVEAETSLSELGVDTSPLPPLPPPPEGVWDKIERHPSLGAEAANLRKMNEARGPLGLEIPYKETAPDGSVIDRTVEDGGVTTIDEVISRAFNKGDLVADFVGTRIKESLNEVSRLTGKKIKYAGSFFSVGSNKGDYRSARKFQKSELYSPYMKAIQGSELDIAEEEEELIEEIQKSRPGWTPWEETMYVDGDGAVTGLISSDDLKGMDEPPFTELKYLIDARFPRETTEFKGLEPEVGVDAGWYVPVIPDALKTELERDGLISGKYADALDQVFKKQNPDLFDEFGDSHPVIDDEMMAEARQEFEEGLGGEGWNKHNTRTGIFEKNIPWALNAQNLNDEISNKLGYEAENEDAGKALINNRIENILSSDAKEHQLVYMKGSKVELGDGVSFYVGKILQETLLATQQNKAEMVEEYEKSFAAEGFAPNFTVPTEPKTGQPVVRTLRELEEAIQDRGDLEIPEAPEINAKLEQLRDGGLHAPNAGEINDQIRNLQDTLAAKAKGHIPNFSTPSKGIHQDYSPVTKLLGIKGGESDEEIEAIIEKATEEELRIAEIARQVTDAEEMDMKDTSLAATLRGIVQGKKKEAMGVSPAQFEILQKVLPRLKNITSTKKGTGAWGDVDENSYRRWVKEGYDTLAISEELGVTRALVNLRIAEDFDAKKHFTEKEWATIRGAIQPEQQNQRGAQEGQDLQTKFEKRFTDEGLEPPKDRGPGGQQKVDIPSDFLKEGEVATQNQAILKELKFETDTYKRWDLKYAANQDAIRKASKQMMVDETEGSNQKRWENILGTFEKRDTSYEQKLSKSLTEAAIASPGTKSPFGVKKGNTVTYSLRELMKSRPTGKFAAMATDKIEENNWDAGKKQIQSSIDIDWINTKGIGYQAPKDAEKMAGEGDHEGLVRKAHQLWNKVASAAEESRQNRMAEFGAAEGYIPNFAIGGGSFRGQDALTAARADGPASIAAVNRESTALGGIQDVIYHRTNGFIPNFYDGPFVTNLKHEPNSGTRSGAIKDIAKVHGLTPSMGGFASQGRSKGHVPNFEFGAGAEMSIMLAAFGQLADSAGDLGEGWNKLVDQVGFLPDALKQTSLKSAETLDKELKDAADALANFNAAADAKLAEAGLTGEKREEKKKEIIKGMADRPDEAYEDIAIRGVAETQLQEEHGEKWMGGEGGLTEQDRQKAIQERSLEITATIEETRSEDFRKAAVTEDGEREGFEHVDMGTVNEVTAYGATLQREMGSEAVTTPKALKTEQEEDKKDYEDKKKELSELKELLAKGKTEGKADEGKTPGAGTTASPAGTVSEKAERAKSEAAKSDIDNATININTATINVKKSEPKERETSVVPPASPSSSPVPTKGDLAGAYGEERFEEAKVKAATESMATAGKGAEGVKRNEETGEIEFEAAGGLSAEEIEENFEEALENADTDSIAKNIKESLQKELEDLEVEVGGAKTKSEASTKALGRFDTEADAYAETRLKQQEQEVMGQTVTEKDAGVEAAQAHYDKMEQQLADIVALGSERGGGEGSAVYQEQEKLRDEAKADLEDRQGWVGESRETVEQNLRMKETEARAAKKQGEVEKDRSRKAGAIGAVVAGVGTGGIEALAGPEESAGKTAALGVTKGITEATQIMAALPGAAGVALGVMKGLGTAGEAAIEAMSGIASLRKEAEIQKKQFQQISAGLTEYGQALAELTNSYGDPTVTQKTIDRLNKKMMDVMGSMPQTKEAAAIRASISTAATPEQKQRAIAEGQDMMQRETGKSEQRVDFAERALKRDQNSNLLMQPFKFLGAGGGWSGGQDTMFERRNIFGVQSDAAKLEQKEGLRNIGADFFANLSAPQTEAVSTTLSQMPEGASIEGMTKVLDDMVKMGVISKEMADKIKESNKDIELFINQLDEMNDARKRNQQVMKEMAKDREANIVHLNGLKLASQAAQGKIKDLTETMQQLNALSIERSLQKGERATDISAAFGRGGSIQGGGDSIHAAQQAQARAKYATAQAMPANTPEQKAARSEAMRNAGVIGLQGPGGITGIGKNLLDPQAESAKLPALMGRTGRAALGAEIATAESMGMGAESAARAKEALELNEVMEGAQIEQEQIQGQGRRDVAEAAKKAIGAVDLTTVIPGAADSGGAKTVSNQDMIRAQTLAAATIAKAVEKGAKENMTPDELQASMMKSFQEAAIAEAIGEASDAERGELEQMQTDLQNNKPIDEAKLQTLLAGNRDEAKAEAEGSAVDAYNLAAGANLDAETLKAQQDAVAKLDALNIKTLEQIQTMKKNHIEAAKQRQAARDKSAAGGIGAFMDRKQERQLDRNTRRAAMSLAMSKDPVRQGRAAVQLSDSIKEMAGGGMSALQGTGLQDIAIKGNTQRIEAQVDRQLKDMDRAIARAPAGSAQQKALQQSKKALVEVKGRAGKIAETQVKNQMALEEQPANIKASLDELKKINERLERAREAKVKLDTAEMNKGFEGPIKEQTSALLSGIDQLAGVMDRIQRESSEMANVQEKKQAAFEMVAMAEQKGIITKEEAEKKRAEIRAAGDNEKDISAVATGVSKTIAGSKQAKSFSENEAQAFGALQQSAGVGSEAHGVNAARDAVTAAQADMDKANRMPEGPAKEAAKKKAQAKLDAAQSTLQEKEAARSVAVGTPGGEHHVAGQQQSEKYSAGGMLMGALGLGALGGMVYGGKKLWDKRGGGKGGGGASAQGKETARRVNKEDQRRARQRNQAVRNRAGMMKGDPRAMDAKGSAERKAHAKKLKEERAKQRQSSKAGSKGAGGKGAPPKRSPGGKRGGGGKGGRRGGGRAGMIIGTVLTVGAIAAPSLMADDAPAGAAAGGGAGAQAGAPEGGAGAQVDSATLNIANAIINIGNAKLGTEGQEGGGIAQAVADAGGEMMEGKGTITEEQAATFKAQMHPDSASGKAIAEAMSKAGASEEEKKLVQDYQAQVKDEAEASSKMEKIAEDEKSGKITKEEADSQRKEVQDDLKKKTEDRGIGAKEDMGQGQLKAIMAAVAKIGGDAANAAGGKTKIEQATDKAVEDKRTEEEKAEDEKKILTDEKLKQREEEYKGDKDMEDRLKGEVKNAKERGDAGEVTKAEAELRDHQTKMKDRYGGMDAEGGQFYTAEEFEGHAGAVGAGSTVEGMAEELTKPKTEEEKAAAEEAAVAAKAEEERLAKMSPEAREDEKLKQLQAEAMPVLVTNWPASLKDLQDTSGRVIGSGMDASGAIINYGEGDLGSDIAGMKSISTSDTEDNLKDIGGPAKGGARITYEEGVTAGGAKVHEDSEMVRVSTAHGGARKGPAEPLLGATPTTKPNLGRGGLSPALTEGLLAPNVPERTIGPAPLAPVTPADKKEIDTTGLTKGPAPEEKGEAGGDDEKWTKVGVAIAAELKTALTETEKQKNEEAEGGEGEGGAGKEIALRMIFDNEARITIEKGGEDELVKRIDEEVQELNRKVLNKVNTRNIA